MMALVGGDEPRHAHFADLPDFLTAGDLLVVNDTRVIPARLFGRRVDTGGRIEILLVERQAERTWTCLAKPGRKARVGAEIDFDSRFTAEVLAKGDDGRHTIRFSEPPEPHLDEIGAMPLPPYIKRAAHAEDADDYQTIFAGPTRRHRRPDRRAPLHRPDTPTAGL